LRFHRILTKGDRGSPKEVLAGWRAGINFTFLMKIPTKPFAISLAVLSLATPSGFAQEVAKDVAFLTPAQTYVSCVRGGVLGTKSKTITAMETFKLTDANGGELADGDVVKISATAGSKEGKASFWSEKADGTITRIRKDDASVAFIVKKKDAGITLKTASGKFVSNTAAELGTTAEEAGAVVLKVVPAPAAPAAPTAAKETPDQ
jgi:hypothetical protein